MNELIDRLRYRFNDYWHSEKRSVKLISRLLAFTLFAAVISTIAPTLADELSSDPAMLEPLPQVQESSTITIQPETPTASATPTPTPTSSPTISRPAIATPSDSPLPESTESATAEAEAAPLEIQPHYIIKVPATIAVDPRATSVFAPHLFASVDLEAAPFTMICVSGTSGTRFDALQKGVANESLEADLISGDRTGVLVLSAETNRAINLLNSYQGLFLTTWGGGISGRSLTYQFVAVSKPVVNPEFCSAARSSATSTIRSLALDLSTVKGGGRLK